MDGTIFRTFIGVLAASAAFLLHASPIESADVVVIGGSEAGVSAALAARKAGAPAIEDYGIYNFKSKKKELCRGAASVPDGERSSCLKELSLARALYRLGDRGGLARRSLAAYAKDPRRAYAEHARMVLGKQ